ncbi:MAG TPA: enoyl-CoA hydratase/isomerase family protein, partial [Rariglobus sp.]
MNNTYDLATGGSVATLTLARAHALNTTGKHALLDALAALAREPEVRCLIFTASHPLAWTVDVAELAEMSPSDARAFSAAGQALADAIAALPFPAIAAVDGPALGGGCELVLACDVAFAGENAKLGQIEAQGGVMPGFGGTWRLTRRVGFQRAAWMIFTAAVLDAQAAKGVGLVLDVVPSGELNDHCKETATRIAAVSTNSVREAKRVLHA